MLAQQNLHKDLIALSDPIKKEFLPRFFKTGKGEYAEGDIFLGVVVPDCRKIAIKYRDLPLAQVVKVLKSKIHEKRLIALFILIHKFQKGDTIVKKNIYDVYLKNTSHVNNWDLVDLSAPKILGEYLRSKKDRSILLKLACSENLWERRIAMIATYQFIAFDKSYKDTFQVAEILILDKNDLIQKAVGWMLREVGKRISQKTEREFLDTYYKELGRTALRYAIEHFDNSLRQKYLKGEI